MLGQRVGNYRIDKLLGEGGMGTVYLATDLNARRPVAIKFMSPNLANDPQFQQRFMQEAQAAARLDHPNIVRVLQYNAQPGQLYIVMEYLNAGSLRAYLQFLAQQQKTLGSNEAIRLTQQIAEALSYAHRAGIVHRDVKPENVLLRNVGDRNNPVFQALLSDFGLARLLEGMPQSMGQPKGTFAYMSPEQCRGERVDARSDIYSLGVMLYELIVGRLPFQPKSLSEAIRMHSQEAVTPPSRVRPGVPRDLEQIILRSLAKSPNERFQSAGEMARSLQTLQSGGARAGNTMPDGAVPRGRPQPTQYLDQPISPVMPAYEALPAVDADVGRTRIVFSREGQPVNFVWVAKDVMYVGRDPDKDVVLESSQVSRNHARLDKGYDGRYRITDLGSTNGVFLGANKLTPNQPTEWLPGQIARIGDFWMRLEMVAAPSQKRPDQQAVAEHRSAIAGIDQRSVVPAASTPQATTDKIGVKLLQDVFSVAAGGRAIITVSVSNLGNRIDHFSAEVRGIPAEWYTVPTDPLRLGAPQGNVQGAPSQPGQPQRNEPPSSLHTTGNLQITLNPPRNSGSLAGTHNFDVLIRSGNDPNAYASRPGKLQIEPFYGLTTDIHPKRLRGSNAAELQITNTGNVRENYGISASDPEQALEIRLDQPQIAVEPGKTERIIVRARPRSRPIMGVSRNMPFSVSVKSTRPEGDQQLQSAELAVSPFLPAWVLSISTLGMIGCIIAAILALLSANANNTANQGASQVAQTQLPVVSQTAGASADDDGDGLSNAEELKLGTDPEKRDTDGDGLTDYEEVKKYKTNPLAQDSDNDNLSDGVEINGTHTNPLNPDTDGDGIPDGVDSAPLFTSTPTVDVLATQTAAQGTVGANNAFVTQTALQNALQTAIAQQTQGIVGITQTAAAFTRTPTPTTTPTPTATPTPTPTATPQPQISISDPPAITEGNVNGTVALNFVASLSIPNPGPGNVTVTFTVNPGTAVAGSDYNPPAPGQLTFIPGGPTAQTITVPIISDTIAETTTETFTVTLSNPGGASILKATGVGTINDDDSIPLSMSINDPPSVTEGTGAGTTVITFNVTLSQPNKTGSPITVDASTVDGTATSASDYTAVSAQTLTFPPCSPPPCTAANQTQSLDVTVTRDTTTEPTETLSVLLSNPNGATITKSSGIGTILDDDLPQVSVNDPGAVAENAGPIIFAVSLSQPNPGPGNITVNFTTMDGAAQAGSDYTAATGVVTFPPSNQTQNVSINLINDALAEQTETFQLALSNPVGTTIAKGTGIGTITNDDLVRVTIDDVSVVEGNAPGTFINFTVTLSQPNPGPGNIVLNVNTVDVTAVAPSDYTAISGGTLTFAPGEITKSIFVDVIGDVAVEPDETFRVDLTLSGSSALPVVFVKSEGFGSIVNDD
jgi:serine/threonine protein kinase